MSVTDLPAVNATLNGMATVFIVAGIVSIKREHKLAHITFTALALVTSAIFLACYLTYHFSGTPLTRFAHPGWPKALYYFILIPHTILAMVSLPLIIMTVVPALRARWDRHRRLAAWTWPVWLYVSVTGVLVYLMLYRWFPGSR